MKKLFQGFVIAAILSLLVYQVIPAGAFQFPQPLVGQVCVDCDLIGGSINGGTFNPGWTVTATSGVAANGAFIAVDTSSSAVTMTLPASAVNSGATFVDAKGTFATNNLTINAPTGVPINSVSGSPASMTISTNWAKWVCVYLNSSIGYRCYN